MPRKSSFSINIDMSVLLSILIGIIVLMGVYIIVSNKKQVTFADPVITQEVLIPDYYVENVRTEPIFLQQPTYFNPNLGRDTGHTTNMYNIQAKEPFTVSDFVSGMFPTLNTKAVSLPPIQPSASSISMMPSIQPSQTIPMNIPSPMESASDSVSDI